MTICTHPEYFTIREVVKSAIVNESACSLTILFSMAYGNILQDVTQSAWSYLVVHLDRTPECQAVRGADEHVQPHL